MGACMLAMGIFAWLIHPRRQNASAVQKAAAYVSRASFCVYLVHIFFIYILRDLGCTANTLPILAIPILSVSIFALSLCVYGVLSRVPLVRKWLI